MIVMPITGYLGTYRDAEYLGITKFGDTSLFAWVAATVDTTWEEFEIRLDFVYREFLGPKLLWMLISIHVGAALFHHFYRSTAISPFFAGMRPRSANRRQSAESAPERIAAARCSPRRHTSDVW
ncbi:hypothetical protein [uncultured Sulfitobacter sp.]|uniref:hypothetical protein n=1 Tax=uncultured Sulfitobacter sp. TaxID=191468 RepID=UPI0025973EC3|nr:hypothetical protein [uncultured Sulfitobacter sp.]